MRLTLFNIAAIVAAVLLSSCSTVRYSEKPSQSYDVIGMDGAAADIVDELKKYAEENGKTVSESKFTKEKYTMFALSLRDRTSMIVAMNPSRNNEIRIISYLRVNAGSKEALDLNSEMDDLMHRISKLNSVQSILPDMGNSHTADFEANSGT